ncbi:MAG: hypothetical protein AAF851_22925, partial [Myxococcota bacterium]
MGKRFRYAHMTTLALVGLGTLHLACQTGTEPADSGTEAEDMAAPDGGVSPEDLAAVLSVEPGTIDFGNVVVNTEATRILEVTNTGLINAPVEFLPDRNIEVCGQANISAFCLVEPTSDFENNNETFPLGSGETRRLEIRFKPTVANAQERSSFTLRYCAQGGACVIDISATGFSVEKAFSCEPQALDFGAVNPGASADALVTCSATANQQVT